MYNRKLTSYNVCEGTEIIAKNAFENCSMLSEVTFPESLTAIEEFVFKFCRNLKLVKGGKNVVSIGNEAFNDTSFYSEANFVIVGKVLVRCNIDSRKIIIPDEVEYIAPYAVAGDEYGWNENDFVTEIVVHQSVKKIGQGAFAYRRRLSKINLPEGIEEIPSYLFVKCNSLKTIFIPSTVRRIQIENASFPEKDSFTAVFPIDFNDPEFERFIVDKRNLYFKSVDGILFSKDGSSVLAVPPKCPIDNFIIPNEVKTIKKGAFQYNKTIKTLTFTNGNINVEYCDVESGTFMGSNIREVIFPESMKKIQSNMFFRCSELSEVVLPENLTEIEDNAFYGTKINRLDLPSSLKRIGDTAFGFCKIDQLVLPDDLEYIEDYAFACNKIKRVVLPKALKKLGFCAFAGAEEIEIYDTLLCSEEMRTEIPNILGYIGFYKSDRDMSMSSNYDKWFDYTLTVRSSDTGKTKFKIYMCSTGEKKSVYKQLPNLWSTSDSFDFIGYDSLFENLKSLDNKVKIAMYRIDYPYNLTDENRKMYQSFF